MTGNDDIPYVVGAGDNNHTWKLTDDTGDGWRGKPVAFVAGEPHTTFKMLDPLPTLRDENGEYRCPMPTMNREYDEHDNVMLVKAMCGQELAVHWTLVTPVPDPPETIAPADVSRWANCSGWELRCANGHVLATSSEHGGYEDAQSFDTRHWFK